MKFASLTFDLIGAAMEVHTLLGPGFLESIYKHSLCHELSLRGLQTKTEAEIHISYKGHHVGKHRLDLVVDDAVIVEIKGVSAITMPTWRKFSRI